MARLKLRQIAVAVVAACGCSSAFAVPAAIFVAMGASAAAAAAYSVVSAVVFGAVMSNQAKRKQAAAAAAQRSQYNSSLQDRNVTGLSGESAWQLVYGSPAPVGGSLISMLSSGDRDQFKHLLIEFAAHECQSIDEVYIEGEPVGPMDAGGWCTQGTFFETRNDRVHTEWLNFNAAGVATSSRVVVEVVQAQATDFTANSDGVFILAKYVVTGSGNTLTMRDPTGAPIQLSVSYRYFEELPRVNVQKHLSPGGVDVADAFIMGRLPAMWTPADRLSGHTYIWITLDQNMARFQGGPPNVTARLRGKRVYDPRTGATAYSANPALCLADFITSEPGFGASLSQFDTAALIASANAADAAGFNCDGAFRTEQDRESTKQQLEDCFGGTCHESGGVWRVTPGAWTSPVMSITDADMAAPVQILQASYTAKERYNTVRGKFIDGAGLGVSLDFTPWSNPAYLVVDGVERARDVTFPFTKDHQRCQDLARMIVERSRGGLTISYPGHMRLWPLQPGDRVAITNAEFGWTAKTFRVTDWGFHPKTPVALQLVEDVAAFYNPAAVITGDAAPNTNLPDPMTVPDVANLTAASGTDYLIKQSDGSIITRVLVQWRASDNNYVVTGGNVQAQWRPASDTGDAWQDAPPLPGSASSTFLVNLSDGEAALIRVRFTNQLGIPGNWSTIAHDVVGKSEPPGAVTNVALTQQLVFYTGVKDLDLAGYQIRVVPGTNAQWSMGVPVHDGLVTDSPYEFLRRLTGLQTVMVAAVDDGGRVGVAGAATLDFGVIDPYNIAQQIDFKALGWPGQITNASVVGSALVADADPAVDFWAIGGDDFWTHDNAADFWGGSAYLPMQYIATYTPAYAGGDIILDSAVSGSRAIVEWRVDGGLLGDFWSRSVGGDFWGGSADFWGVENAWQPYVGSISSVDGQSVQFRVSVDGGPQQGQIAAEVIRLQMPDKEQVFANIAISALGTRLSPAAGTPALSWIAVEEVNFTIYADGSGAAFGRVTNFDPILGPQVETLNAAGTPVSSTAQTARVRGF